MANAVIVSAIDLAVSFIGLLLTIVGLAGVSEDSDTIKNVAWAKWSDEGYMDLGFLGEGELKISFYAATRRVVMKMAFPAFDVNEGTNAEAYSTFERNTLTALIAIGFLFALLKVRSAARVLAWPSHPRCALPGARRGIWPRSRSGEGQ